jgi:NADP-dependent 3-hydroxy acid dehydrogenase YdfG
MQQIVHSNLEGRIAVITGAGGGIGLALALEAAQRGMNVALADIGPDALQAAKARIEELGVKAIAVRTDVRNLAELEALRDTTAAQLGDPWLVINNAGVAKIALAWETSEADWRRMLDINVWGVVNGLLAFLPGLRERKSGYILNTASVGGLLSMPANAAYVASKHAVVGLSETLYRELEADGGTVGISVLCPALVKTAIAGTREVDGKQVSAIDSPPCHGARRCGAIGPGCGRGATILDPDARRRYRAVHARAARSDDCTAQS